MPAMRAFLRKKALTMAQVPTGTTFFIASTYGAAKTTTIVTNAGSNSKFLGVIDFDVKNGKIARVSNHYNLKDWLAQVK